MRGMTFKASAVLIFNLFQSTCPYAGHDDYPIITDARTINFNPHAPMRGMTKQKAQQKQENKFQSTCPYAGHDPDQAAACGYQFEFQSTCPYAGHDFIFFATGGILSYFNPHAPMRGMTVLFGYDDDWYKISIHMPLCGA